MRPICGARLVMMLAALLFVRSLGAQTPTTTPTPTPTASPVCTPATETANGCYDIPADLGGAMAVPSWFDPSYSTNEIGELVLIRQELVALRRFMVIIGGALLAFFMNQHLFDAITGRR